MYRHVHLLCLHPCVCAVLAPRLHAVCARAQEPAEGAAPEAAAAAAGADPAAAAAAAHTGSTACVHPLLSSFINYAQPIKFAGFENAISERRPQRVSDGETLATGPRAEKADNVLILRMSG